MPRRPRDHWYSAAVEAADQSKIRIWSRTDLQELHRRLTTQRQMPRSTSLESLQAVLADRGRLRTVELRPVLDSADGDTARRPFRRLVWGDVSALEIALSLRPRSYLSHGSAMLVNALVDGLNNRVYVNQEQSPKQSPTGTLTQGSIDRAFQNRARASTYVFRHDAIDIALLSGKNTQDYGVIETTFAGSATVRTTGLARTLVDITVRPGYAGGTRAVLEAYRRALTREPAGALVAEIMATLNVLSHLYPYHQAAGFYLEQAGVDEAATEPLRTRGLSYDFYLDYAMEASQHNPKWRVYYPTNLL
jgi:hypothetical protein